MLLGWLLATADITFIIVNSTRFWFEGWMGFWSLRFQPSLFAWAVLVAAIPFLLIWVLVPAFVLFGTTSASDYVRYRADDTLHLSLLAVASIAATWLNLIAAPTIAVLTWSSYVKGVTALLSLSTAASAVGLASRFSRHLKASGTSFLVPIRQFPTELRPQNTRVLNVDCGALAPRLNVVAEGLEAWSRLINGSAPTAKLWWDAVSNSRTELPRQWQKNLKGRAWTGIEAFRRNVAELVQVDSASVVLLPSPDYSRVGVRQHK